MRKQFFLLFALVIVWGTNFSPLFSQPFRGININETELRNTAPKTNYAFLIGINNYEHWPRLNNAVKDCLDIKKMLVSKYGLRGENIILLIDNEASRRNILDNLKKLGRALSNKDNLFIYYSGHGNLDKNVDIGYWIPVDGERDSSEKWVSNNEIIAYLRGIKTKHTFIVADSCFSGSMFGISSKGFVEEVDRYKSRQGLTSGREEVVSDGRAGENSPFARYMLTYMQKESGYFTASEISQYVKRAVANNADQTPVDGRFKNCGDEGGEFVFIPIVKASLPPDDEGNEGIRRLKEKLAAVEAKEGKVENEKENVLDDSSVKGGARVIKDIKSMFDKVVGDIFEGGQRAIKELKPREPPRKDPESQ